MPPKQEKLKKGSYTNIKDNTSETDNNSIQGTDAITLDKLRFDNSITASGNSLLLTSASSSEQNPIAQALKDILDNNNYDGKSHPAASGYHVYPKLSSEIIRCAIENFRDTDSTSKNFKASYLLTALGTALLREESVNNRMQEIQDPLAFKIKTLQKQRLEKELTYNFLSNLSALRIGPLEKLQQQYAIELDTLHYEYKKVSELYHEKEALHEVFGNSFPYIPKKLSNTSIEKYNSLFKKNYSADGITKELSEFRVKLNELEKFNKLFRNTAERIESLQDNIKKHLNLINNEIKLSKIFEHYGNDCPLAQLLKPRAQVKNFSDNEKSIQAARKTFAPKQEGQEQGGVLLNKIRTEVRDRHQKKMKSFIEKYNKIFPGKNINEIKLQFESFSSDYSKIKQMANFFDCDDNDFKNLLKKVENHVAITLPEDCNPNVLNKENIAKLREHLTNSHKYTIDSEYLESLSKEHFLVQVRVYKKLGRDMIKNILLLSASGCETIKINMPPGINTTLEISPTGSTKYLLGELGSYNKISILNLCTLKNYQSFICEDMYSKEKENEFKFLSQIEAIRNCSALLTIPMFFELARAGFVQYKDKQPQKQYNVDNIKAQMPMAMKGAVPGSVYLEKQFSELLKEDQLCYDYRAEGKEKNGKILAARDYKILFDWLCYKLSASDNDPEKIFYTKFSRNTNIEDNFTQKGWRYQTKGNQIKLSKGTQGLFIPIANFAAPRISYELIAQKVMTSDKKVLVTISEIQRFPLKMFDSLITNWYGKDIVTNNDAILIGDLKVSEFNVETCGEG